MGSFLLRTPPSVRLGISFITGHAESFKKFIVVRVFLENSDSLYCSADEGYLATRLFAWRRNMRRSTVLGQYDGVILPSR